MNTIHTIPSMNMVNIIRRVSPVSVPQLRCLIWFPFANVEEKTDKANDTGVVLAEESGLLASCH
jgi:hypothetical protein